MTLTIAFTDRVSLLLYSAMVSNFVEDIDDGAPTPTDTEIAPFHAAGVSADIAAQRVLDERVIVRVWPAPRRSRLERIVSAFTPWARLDREQRRLGRGA